MSIVGFRRRVAAFILAVSGALPAVAQAQQLYAPNTGLWHMQDKLLMNGKDGFLTALRDMQKKELQALPPAQRKQAEATMKDPTSHYECLTAQEAAKMRDSKTLLAEMAKDSPGCRFEALPSSGNTLRFKGHCADPDSFIGDVQGEMRMISTKEWQISYSGKGRFTVPEELRSYGFKPGDLLIDVRMEQHARWVAAQCGKVAP